MRAYLAIISQCISQKLNAFLIILEQNASISLCLNFQLLSQLPYIVKKPSLNMLGCAWMCLDHEVSKTQIQTDI